MKNIRTTNVYKTMDAYTACSIAEGFANHPPRQDEAQAAWQWLVDTGMCWKLQGFYGRTVTDLLQRGLLLPPIKTHKDYYGNIVDARVSTVKGTK